jgi:hypothetical protein
MKKTAREKLISGLKRSGYDVEKRHKYWSDMSKELEKQKKDYEKKNSELKERCWPGHKAVPGKKPYSPGSCVKEDGAVAAGPTNSVGGGAIAGVGVGPQGEPGVNMKKRKKVMPFNMFVRKKPNQ